MSPTTPPPLSITFPFSVFVPLDLFRNRHTKGLRSVLFCSVLLHHIHFQLQVPSCCRVIFSLRWISIASILRHLSQMLLLLLLLRHLLYYLRLHLNVSHFTDALIIQRNKIEVFSLQMERNHSDGLNRSRAAEKRLCSRDI